MLFHATVYGLALSVPMSVPFAKKSTWSTMPSLSDAVAVTLIFAGALNVAPSSGLVTDTLGGVLPPTGTPHASTSIIRLYPLSAAVTYTRIFVVASGANVTCRHTRLLLMIAPPGASTHVEPSQYCTSNPRSP